MKPFHFFLYQTTRFISPLGISAEWVFVAIAAAIVAALPRTLIHSMEWLGGAFKALAQRRNAAILFVGVFPIAVRLLMLPIAHVPSPSIHDEFSHLLWPIR